MFLEAFGEGGPFGTGDIFQRLRKISCSESETEYYVSSPQPFASLFKTAALAGYIKKETPVSWKLTVDGLEQREYLKERYINAN